MATHVVVPAYCLYRLPASVDSELGALAEPLAVTVHALRLANVGPDSTVLVLGAGTIGQMTIAAARHLGARRIGATARYAQQRAAAERLGCDEVLSPDQPRRSERPTVVIDTVGGHASTVADAVQAIDAGGTVVITGLFEDTPRFDPLTMLMKEVRIVASMVYNRRGPASDFDTALEILASWGPSPWPSEARLPGMEPKRADVIVAGCAILAEALPLLGFERLTVSDRGVRWGLIHDRFGGT